MTQHKVWFIVVVLIGLLTTSCVAPGGDTGGAAESAETTEKATIDGLTQGGLKA